MAQALNLKDEDCAVILSEINHFKEDLGYLHKGMDVVCKNLGIL